MDPKGRFQLEVPHAREGRLDVGWGTALGVSSGLAHHLLTVRPGALPPGLPVRLVVGPPALSRFEVRGPDGQPIAGATITPRVLNRQYASVPDGLAELIAAETRTDEQGRAVLTAVFPEEISTIIVTAPGLGSQQFGFGHRDVTSETKVVRLSPAGHVKGRLTGPAEAVSGRKLTVRIWSPKGSPALALSFVTTDKLGRFDIPEIAEGSLSVNGEPNITSPWYVPFQKDLKIEAGRTTEIEIPLAKAVPITGLVQEKGTGEGIPGVHVAAGWENGPTVKTDEAGRFAGYSRPGIAGFSLRRVPQGHASLMYGVPEAKIPENATEFAIPPIELSRAGVVRGLVVDLTGKPVAGADVEAAWQVDEGPKRQGRREVSVRSGPDGTFAIHDVTEGSDVELSARSAGARTAQSSIARTGAPEPVRLHLDENSGVTMKGRVLGPGGRPLARAQVHLRAQKRYPGGQVKGDELVEFEGSAVLITDAEGRFLTPKQLAPDGEYAAFAASQGLLPDRTPWTKAELGSFPDLILRPEMGTGEFEGTVRDRAGHPVPGAIVWTSEAPSVRVRSDDAGRFRLDSLREGRGFLFFRKDGFRFGGQVFDPSLQSVELVLIRADEPPSRRLETLHPPLLRADEIKLARGLLEPRMERILKDGDPRSRKRLLCTLAALDPARALEVLEKGELPDPDGSIGTSVRSRAAISLVRLDPARSAAVVETIRDAYPRG